MVFFPVGVHASSTYNPKIVLACIGVFTMTVVYSLGAFVTNPDLFVWSLGVTLGLLKSFTYSTGVVTAISQFPERKGFVGGFVISGFGVGGFIFTMLSKIFCNPDDLRPELVETPNGE